MMLPALTTNDTIGFISPAGPLKHENVAGALQRVKDLGYNYILGQYAFDDAGIVSSAAENRITDIHAFVDNPQVKAIWALRGGYGTVHLFEGLDFQRIRNHPKILVGFSDVTALQWAWYRKTGLPSVSGLTMTLQMMPDNPWVDAGRELLAGQLLQVDEKMIGSPVEIVRHGSAEGILLGGTVSMIASICGSEYWPSAQPLILYLEDVEEPLYRIDRCLQQLALSGLFRRVCGLILGHFTWQDKFLDIRELILPLLPDDIPIVSGFPYGHVPASFPMPNGVPANLHTSPFLLEWAPFIESAK